MENTKIEWATHTFNPWIGCTKVSPGCANCYAETLNNRLGWVECGPGGERKRTSVQNWNQVRKWNRQETEKRQLFPNIPWARHPIERPRVFVASLADWLDESVPIEWVCDLLALIGECEHLDFLLLTKRPENWESRIEQATKASRDRPGGIVAANWYIGRMPQNVWFGVSAEDQKYYDRRVGIMGTIPARFRFVSAEPLLGPIVMSNKMPLPDWIIVGGESGPGARPISREWVEALQEEAALERVAFFFKQWGGVNKKEAGRELSGRLYSELPFTP